MAVVGSCPVGTSPVGSACGARSFRPAIEAVEYEFAPDNITIGTNYFYVENVEYTFEVEDLHIVQAGIWAPELVELGYEIPHEDPVTEEDGIQIGQRHQLAMQDMDYGFEVEELVIEQPAQLVIADAVVYTTEVADPVIGQRRLVTIPDMEIPWLVDANETLTITQRCKLQIEANEVYHGIPNLWIFLPTSCLSYNSTRVRDGGLLLDDTPGGTPQVGRFYTEDRYRFRLEWEAVNAEMVEVLRGFFERYRYQEFLFTWPEDDSVYKAIIAADVKIDKVTDHKRWTGSVDLVGTEVPEVEANELLKRGMQSFNLPGSHK